jgi:copper transport protein
VKPRARDIAVVCALVLLAVPSSASAHAALLTANPGSGAVVRQAPRALVLSYDEDVVPQYARVSVIGPRGQNLAGPSHVTGSNVTIPLRSAPTGSYTVRWRMVASDDGHTTQGAFTYGVRVRPQPPAPLGSVNLPVAPELLAWLQFIGIVLTGGMLTFRALVWTPAVRGHDEVVDREAPVTIRLAVIGAVVALHAGLFAFLAGAYPIVGGGGLGSFVNTEIEPIRVGTHLGQAWMATTFAWFVVLGLLVSAWVYPRVRERLLAGAGLVALAIAFGLSWASHPDSHGTPALLADYVHLLAGALWVGGLVAIVIAARAVPRSAREDVVRGAILQFSRLAAPTVAVVALAGVYLALRELPSASALVSSGYGVTLLVKAAVAFGAFLLGGYHRRFVVPRLASGAPIAAIRRTLTLELGVLVAVLALAAVLTQRAPPA